MNEENLREQYTASDSWGLLTSIDLHHCNAQTIRDAEKIKQFVIELCDLIEMKRFGDCTVVNFGEDERVAGYSMFQLIETSCISGHFANQTNAVYLDIFSCKFYEPKVAADFAQKFFGAADYNESHTLRK
jgi:S-adenosylmethionine/arginine decarboxylase-like enzyme